MLYNSTNFFAAFIDSQLMAKEDGAYRALVEAQTGRPSNLNNATRDDKTPETDDDKNGTNDDDRRTSVFVPSTDKSLMEQGNELVLKVTID